jgi:hypothetical protein
MFSNASPLQAEEEGNGLLLKTLINLLCPASTAALPTPFLLPDYRPQIEKDFPICNLKFETEITFSPHLYSRSCFGLDISTALYRIGFTLGFIWERAPFQFFILAQ